MKEMLKALMKDIERMIAKRLQKDLEAGLEDLRKMVEEINRDKVSREEMKEWTRSYK